MYIHEYAPNGRARHDGWLRAAASRRLAAQTRQARAERTSDTAAAPARRLTGLRLRLRQLPPTRHHPKNPATASLGRAPARTLPR